MSDIEKEVLLPEDAEEILRRYSFTLARGIKIKDIDTVNLVLQAIFSAVKALYKQVPKKIDRVGNKCPVCKCYLASQPIPDHYCFNCGQAIDWSEEE